MPHALEVTDARDRAAAALFAGPGEMRARCRAFDWGATPLGPVSGWSHSLRTVAATVLGSRSPMFLFWGAEAVQLYNDAYRPSLGESRGPGDRHPSALGARGAAFWTEIWHVIGPQIAQVLGGGEATWHEDQHLPIWRNGRLEDVWWTYSYGPVPDDDGRVGGVLVTCQETTGRVRAEQALRASEAQARDRLAELEAVYHAAPVGMAVFDRALRYVRINERLAEINGIPAEAHLGRTVRELLPDLADTAEAALRRILDTGEPLRDVEFVGTTPAQPGVERVWNEQWLPLRDAAGAIVGVHAVAEEVTEQRRLAAERERLLAAERAARARAETEARRSAALQGLAVALAAADTPEAVARLALAAGREVAGVVRGSLFLVADGAAPRDTLALVDAVGYDPALLAGWRRVPNTPDTPGGDVAARGEPVILGRRAELARRYPAMRGLLAESDYAGGAVYPLLEHDGRDASAGDRGPARVAGIIGFDFDAERDLGAEDARYLAALADLAGQALDRARLLEAERAARAAAEGERRRLAAVLEHLPVGVTFAEAPDGRHSLSNLAAGAIWGAVPASPDVEAYSREFAGFWVGEGPEAGRRVASHEWPLARALRHGEVVRDAVVEIERPDGSRRVVSLAAAPVRDAAGAITGALVSSTDVTEREALLGRVRAQEAQLAAVFAELPAAVWLADAGGRILRASAAAAAIFGGAPPAVSSAAEYGAYEAYWPAGHPRAGERLTGDDWTLARTLRTGASVAGERLEIVRFDTGERRQVLNSTAPLRDAAGRVVGGVAVMVDVTEREALLAALEAERARVTAARRAAEEARGAAEAANRAKSEFLANMSHELRTPLNAIGGYAQLLDMGLHGPVTDAQRQALGRVQAAQTRLLSLVNDVLNYAKLEAGRVEYAIEAVDLADVVREVAPLVEPQVQAKGLAFAVQLPEAPVVAWADREKLGQVLLNLLSNAVKFTASPHPATGAPGCVRVSVAAGPDAAGALALLRVADTGRGVPRDHLAAIFAPFVQVRAGSGSAYAQATEGTGLGLAISRDLARGMAGDLTVESEVGVGSTFTVTLRRAADAGGPAAERRGGDERREPVGAGRA